VREAGVVRKVEKGKAFVLVRRELASCCGAALCATNGNTTEIVLDAPPGLQPRDEVVIRIPTSFFHSSFALFFIPAALLIAVVVAGQILFAVGRATQVSGYAILAGLMVVIAWYLAMIIFDRRSTRDFSPRIVTVIKH
jgi:positive regulator of sigma E activity